MLNQLITRPELKPGSPTFKLNNKLEELIHEIEKINVTDESIRVINREITALNSIPESGKALKVQLKKTLLKIIAILESENGLVTKNHYQQKGVALGISLGMLFGVALGQLLGNIALLSIGIMFGLSVGLAVGRKLLHLTSAFNVFR